jgi:hypothetical protein
MTKPRTAHGYTSEQAERVQATCLQLASVLGDLMDEIVVVGGLVPSLLIPAANAEEAHVGTTDLDLGLEVGLLASGRYRTLGARLRGAGFEPDRTEEGRVVWRRWRRPGGGATVDFLMPPVPEGAPGGGLQYLEADLAAVVTPGLRLAFRDREEIRLAGRSLDRETLAREIPVCGPGAFVVLKALAFHLSGENKDAYDIYYVLPYYGAAVEDVAKRLTTLMDDEAAQEAVGDLREDFADLDSMGPVRAATFLGRRADDAFRADIVGLVLRLLSAV